MQWERDIEILTPLFNRGAYQDTPELRVPSIRGVVRWWFRALEYQKLPGGANEQALRNIRVWEKHAFGGVQGVATASPLVFRIRGFQAQRPSNIPTLPHKHGGPASPQAAFPPGARFRLEILTRFGSLPPELESKVVNALETWLLLGALGLRANRSGGNIWPANGAAPQTAKALRARLDEVGCRWPVMLVGNEVGSTLDKLRAAATDTVKSPDWVFGYARGRDRLASALKFKVVRLEKQLRLLAFASDPRVLEEARRFLRGHRSKPETWEAL